MIRMCNNNDYGHNVEYHNRKKDNGSNNCHSNHLLDNVASDNDDKK